MLNRRRDGLQEMTTEELAEKEREERAEFQGDYIWGHGNGEGVFKSTVKATDSVTK
jgi:hypothetical protein